MGWRLWQELLKKFIFSLFELCSRLFEVHWKVLLKIYNFYVDDKFKFYWFWSWIEVWSWTILFQNFSETFCLLLCKCIRKSALGLPTSVQMPTLSWIRRFRMNSGKSAKPMPTSLYVEFSTEFDIGWNNGGKSATRMPTSEVLLPYRKQREVGEPNVDFRTMQALFIVGIWFADFNIFCGSYRRFGSRQTSCWLCFKIYAHLGWSHQTSCRLQFILGTVEVGTGFADFIRINYEQ